MCLQHNFRGVRSSENIGFLGDLPRSLRRGAVGMLELLQPEAQSARQIGTAAGLPLLFVRVSIPPFATPHLSPQDTENSFAKSM